MARREEKVTGPRSITTIAGHVSGFKDGKSLSALFNCPYDVAIDSSGNLIVADCHNHRIRKISSDGQVTTVAGNDTSGNKDGNSTSALFYDPHGVAIDGNGNIVVVDHGNHRICKILPNGDVITFAGNGVSGDKNGNISEAQFNNPWGVAIDANGDIAISDCYNHKIRKISKNGEVTTLAGSGTKGFKDGDVLQTQFNNPTGLVFDNNQNLFVADYGNHRIRKISPNGEVTSISGQFTCPCGIAVDDLNNIVFCGDDHKIHLVDVNGNHTVLAGRGTCGFKDGKNLVANFNYPHGIAIDSKGNVIVADCFNHRIRKINASEKISGKTVFQEVVKPVQDQKQYQNISELFENNSVKKSPLFVEFLAVLDNFSNTFEATLLSKTPDIIVTQPKNKTIESF